MAEQTASIPTQILTTGAVMPGIGLGTFGSDNYTAQQVSNAVREAAEVGYRHFDCAEVYGNESEIGESFLAIQKSGISREDLWITSKVWNHHHHQVEEACQHSISNLNAHYLDLYLVHWPFPNHHEKGVSVDSRDPHAVPYRHDRYMETWQQMEKLFRDGTVRQIGVSNMTIPKLELLWRDAEIKPHAIEMELHPHFQQPELFRWAKDHEMVVIGYSPIGSPSRPERDRTPEDSVDIEDPAIVRAAQRLGVHPAVVCILWQVQRGSVPIPFSVKRAQFEATLQAVCGLRLSELEMSEIGQSDRGCRLIKGQVFLWPSATSWQDLWDEDGIIRQ